MPLSFLDPELQALILLGFPVSYLSYLLPPIFSKYSLELLLQLQCFIISAATEVEMV